MLQVINKVLLMLDSKLQGEASLPLIRSGEECGLGGWHYGIAGKAAAICTADMAYGCQFQLQMLHFWSSSLLMHLRRQPMIAQVLGPLNPWGKPRGGCWPLWLFGKGTRRSRASLSPLSFCLSVSLLCNSNFQMTK